MLVANVIPLAVNLPTSAVGWLGLIVMFSVAISIHELGHLIWAKLFGVGVGEFAVGFGKRLAWCEWRGTVYSIRALPLGGFVKIKGMIPALEEEEERRRASRVKDLVHSAVYESSLAMRDLALWKRLLIFGGGVVNNVLLAFVLLFVLAYALGVPVERAPNIVGWVGADSTAEAAGFQRGDIFLSVNGEPVEDFYDAIVLGLDAEASAEFAVERGGETLTLIYDMPDDFSAGRDLHWPQPPTVAQLHPNQPAERAGMREGDRVLAVNGHAVEHFLDLQPHFAASQGESVALLIARGAERLTLDVTPEHWPSMDRWLVGFFPGDPDLLPERLGFEGSLQYSVGKITAIVVGTLDLLWQIITLQLTANEIGDNIGGPIQIGVIGYQAAVQGLGHFLFIAAALNVALAIFNILPIPILDGGHCLVSVIESAWRRPIPLLVLERVYLVFFAFILLLAVTLVTKDIVANWWRFTG